MYIRDLKEMREKVSLYFEHKADYQGSYVNRGYVLFDLYGILPVRFVILDGPYNTLEFQREVTGERVTHLFLGKELMFIENTQNDVEAAFRVLDLYARLSLPDKFLDAYDALPRE